MVGFHAPGSREATFGVQERYRAFLLQAALAADGKRADRFQFIPEELQSHGIGGIRWEHIADAAPPAELARVFDRIHPLVTAGYEPFREFREIDHLSRS